mmetsp:Transcript_39926/g.120236  ORF Transcript_39926/g.120236 Transcript_39926/m.120236 type:complete len:104 (+) Transcript_39926:401-712(+)
MIPSESKMKGEDDCVLGFLHRSVLRRNAAETAPFESVYRSNLALRGLVDDFQYRCEILDHKVVEQGMEIDRVSVRFDTAPHHGGSEILVPCARERQSGVWTSR